MQAVEKIFPNGYLNADDEVNSLKSGAVLNALNLRFGSTDTGATARWENIPGNFLITNPHLTFLNNSTNFSIGGVADETGRYIVSFNNNTNGDHGIYLYSLNTQLWYKVLLNADVTGGLNFDNGIVQCRIYNNILYWVDRNNEPRKINLGAAIMAYHGVTPIATSFTYQKPFVWSDLTVIRRPPCLTATITKKTDAAFQSNFIQNESFQFAFQYIYWDGEASVLSTWTTSSKINGPSETNNYINIVLNANEVIPAQVRIVRLYVKYGSTSTVFQVKDWDKKIDSTDIDDHNAGSALEYNFYNNIVGEALDGATASKPFDDVPNHAGALEIAKNRLFFGNLTKGYDTPRTTSLSLTPSTVAGGQPSIGKMLTSLVYNVRRGTDNQWFSYAAWLVYLTEFNAQGFKTGFYAIATTLHTHTGDLQPQSLDAPPATCALSTSALIYQGISIDDIIWNVNWPGFPIHLTFEDLRSTNNICLITGLTTSVYNTFKSKSQYAGGMVFFDAQKRKCGVVTADGIVVNTPPRDFNFTQGVGSLLWSVNNTSARNEIPIWAAYYAPLLTKNLRTRFFIQAFDNAAKYATKDSDGNYVFTDTTYPAGCVAIAIDMTALIQANLGYIFSEGDMCELIDDQNNIYDLPILSVQKNYLLLTPKDINDLSTKKFIYEIYTPYQRSTQEPFFEMGQIYPVVNPGKDGRQYSILQGYFSPDCVTLSRNYNTTTYFAEAMSPQDKFYKRWDTDAGALNIVTSEGSKALPTAISFSDTFVPGTQTNGLSSFSALNEELLPLEMGQINTLVNVSRIEDDKQGTVMLALGGAGRRSASIYIGSVQVTNDDATSYFIKSTGVIGQVNLLKGDYGTSNPESVAVLNEDAFFFDAVKGKFLQYSPNGLDSISDGEEDNFKFQRVSALLAQKFSSQNLARPYIFAGVDPYHGEVYWAFPQLGNTVPKGQLSDYVVSIDPWIDSADYPYDILDFKAKTLVYKVRKHWMGAFSWTPEGFVRIGNTVYTLKDGQLWQHGNTTNYNNFFGTQYRSKIALVCNKDNTVKEFTSMALESSMPEWVHFRAEQPIEQSTDLIAADFEVKEGVNYAAIQRDRLTPAASYNAAQVSGDRMRTKALLLLIQFRSNQLIYLRTVTLGYNQSSGHY